MEKENRENQGKQRQKPKNYGKEGGVGRDISNRMTSTFLIFDDKSKKAAILTSAKFIRFCMGTLSTVTGRQGVLDIRLKLIFRCSFSSC